MPGDFRKPHNTSTTTLRGVFTSTAARASVVVANPPVGKQWPELQALRRRRVFLGRQREGLSFKTKHSVERKKEGTVPGYQQGGYEEGAE